MSTIEQEDGFLTVHTEAALSIDLNIGSTGVRNLGPNKGYSIEIPGNPHALHLHPEGKLKLSIGGLHLEFTLDNETQQSLLFALKRS